MQINCTNADLDHINLPYTPPPLYFWGIPVITNSIKYTVYTICINNTAVYLVFTGLDQSKAETIKAVKYRNEYWVSIKCIAWFF